MRLRLKPRDDRFFDLFSVAGANIATATGVLREFVTVPTAERGELAERMRAAEHAGDDATHAIVEQLDRAFITPFDRLIRRAQIASASALALGHGLQDAQKSMGVIVLALVVTGHQDDYHVPFWVILLCATALAAGTWSGGLRIMRTLGRRIFHLTPPHGFSAEISAASVLYLTAFVFAAPVSTTHVMTSSVMGVGATQRRKAVRWSVAGDIAIGWVLTFPGAATIAAVTFGLLSLL